MSNAFLADNYAPVSREHTATRLEVTGHLPEYLDGRYLRNGPNPPGGYTAHPKRDPLTGELHAVSYQFGVGNRMRYSVIGTDGRARRVIDIGVTGAPMMHDFSLTEKYVVFYDLPVTFDPHQTPVRVDVPDPVTARSGRGVRSVPYRATATQWGSVRCPTSPAPCSNTTCTRVLRSAVGSGQGVGRGSSCSFRPVWTPPKTTVSSWDSSSTPPPSAAGGLSRMG